MLNGLKNFAIDRVLRHVADNAKLNVWTNVLAVMIVAALGANADWMLLLSYFSGHTPAGLHELVRVTAAMAGALLLYLTGKFSWLTSWLPVAQDVLAEAAKELEQGKAAKEK